MPTFSDIIKARYPNATDARFTGELIPACAQSRQEVCEYVSNVALVGIDAAVLAVLDELAKLYGSIEIVETALETLRIAIYATFPAGGKELVDPALIGATVIVPATSVTFTAVGAAATGGSWPYGTRRFASLRSACRRAFSIDDVHATVGFVQAL